MAKIICPNKDYTGVSASVAFAAGVGYTDNPRLIDWFRGHGYTVEDLRKMPEEIKAPDPFAGMTDDQIREYAQQNNVNLGNSTARKSIIKKILDAGIKAPGEKTETEEEGATDESEGSGN